MSYVCDYCEFSAPTNSRLKKHLLTQKHARNLLLHQNSDENVQEESDENVQDSVSSHDMIQELNENVQEESDENVQEESNENIQDSVSSNDMVQELNEIITENGYHVISDNDLQYINPIFLDMGTFKLMQNIKNIVNSNPYIIYTIGFLFTLYSSLQAFLFPKDDTIEYIDCTLKED